MTASTELRGVASRYVRALFDLAQEQGMLDAVEKDLVTFRDILNASSELWKFINNPTVSRSNAAQSMEILLKQFKASDVTRRFFALLAANRRLPLIAEAIELFMEELAKSRNELIVDITTARPLSQAHIAALASALKQSTGKKINLRAKEKPEILGGLVLHMGGKMLDHSVEGQLSRLRSTMKMRIAGKAA